jgi:DNA-binding NtrC family response regulator
VLVLSTDADLRGEVEAVVERTVAARAVFAGWEEAERPEPPATAGIVVVDDEGHDDAVDVVNEMKARRPETAVIYLTAHHGLELERRVRQAGVSFYAAKASRGRDLALALESMLRARTRGRARAHEVQRGDR